MFYNPSTRCEFLRKCGPAVSQFHLNFSSSAASIMWMLDSLLALASEPPSLWFRSQLCNSAGSPNHSAQLMQSTLRSPIIILSILDVLMPGTVQCCIEGFWDHAHYNTYCCTVSKSMIILFALVLWEPHKLSYQHHLIIIDSSCDVTRTSLIWIIHVHFICFTHSNLCSCVVAKYSHMLSVFGSDGAYWSQRITLTCRSHEEFEVQRIPALIQNKKEKKSICLQ